MKILIDNQQMLIVPLKFVPIIAIASGRVVHDGNNIPYFAISKEDMKRLKKEESHD